MKNLILIAFVFILSSCSRDSGSEKEDYIPSVPNYFSKYTVINSSTNKNYNYTTSKVTTAENSVFTNNFELTLNSEDPFVMFLSKTAININGTRNFTVDAKTFPYFGFRYKTDWHQETGSINLEITSFSEKEMKGNYSGNFTIKNYQNNAINNVNVSGEFYVPVHTYP